MDELVLAAFLDELAEIEKQAQIFQRVGRLIARTRPGAAIERGVRNVPGAVQRGYHQAVMKSHTVGHLPEALMAGAMKGGSPGAAALHAAPALLHDITPLARRAGQVVKRKVQLARQSMASPQASYAMA